MLNATMQSRDLRSMIISLPGLGVALYAHADVSCLVCAGIGARRISTLWQHFGWIDNAADALPSTSVYSYRSAEY